jgi:hypothetical protein
VASLGDTVRASYTQNLQNIVLTAYVSASGTVNIEFQNQTGSSVTLSAGSVNLWIEKPVNYTKYA